MVTFSVLSELAVHELPLPLTQWLTQWLLGMAFLPTQMVMIRNSRLLLTPTIPLSLVYLMTEYGQIMHTLRKNRHHTVPYFLSSLSNYSTYVPIIYLSLKIHNEGTKYIY